MAEDRSGIHLGFFSGAFPDSGALQLLGVRGKETISQLFEFDLLLERQGAPLTDQELEDIVRKPCVMALGLKQGDLVHGTIVTIEHQGATRHVNQLYVARLVPQVALLAMGQRCGIYEEQSVPEIVESVLKAHAMSKGTDFAVLVADSAKSPTREYVAQFQESDWAFIQRWLEHEGFFYWFEHTKKGAKLVIADSNSDTSKIDGLEKISFREKNNLGAAGEPTVWGVSFSMTRVPQRASVLDYNYRRPSDVLLAHKEIDPTGFGHFYHYGEHVKDRDVADAVVKLRAELHASTKRVLRGTTDCARFRVGHVFELENHYIDAYNDKFLIVSIEHAVGLEVPSRHVARQQADGIAQIYTASFTAIPLTTPFRPPRLTPWPRVSGLISAHVEADTSGDYAQIDDQGRYKVKMPFDVGNRKGLASSRWIRMAQSYAGASYGQHYPLHKGTEVMLGHTDGDPDRPVIVGAVPNPATRSPVTDANATQSVTQTASGIRVEYEDLQS